MRKYKNVVYSKKEIREIKCNICGNPISVNELGYAEEYVTLQKTWGYGSEFDGETHVLDICHCCYKKLFDACRLTPSTTSCFYAREDM